MKTIFISAYNPFIARNILSSDILSIFKKNNIRVIIFVPPAKKNFFEQQYGDKNTFIESPDIDSVIRTKYNKFWYRLAFLLENTQYVKDQRRERLFNNSNILGYINYIRVSITAFILSNISIFHYVYRWLDYIFSPKNQLNEFVKTYHPDLFYSTDVFGEQDTMMLRSAKANGLNSIGMVRSWDNTTTKGLLRVMPNKIITNSEIIKKELNLFHDYALDNIFVSGLPQFDKWIDGPTLSREEFFEKIGADLDKKLILFAPAGSILSDTDWQICQILADAINKNKLIEPVQVLVRNHPHHPADFSKLRDTSNFIFETPGFRFKEGEFKYAEFQPEEYEHLRNSVYYSDIVMYVATSLGLDAAVYNKPQIMISFDGWEKKPYVKSVIRYNREDCLKSLTRLGGTRVVKSEDELIRWINKYLMDPELDHTNRQKIVEKHLYKLDGGAGTRIAKFILDTIR